jgi:predicted Zn-dependent peptidase
MTMPFPTKPPAPLEAGEFCFPASVSFSLENGMGLTVVENRRLPVVGIQLGIMSGLTRAEYEKPGITSVAADMLCKGTAKRSAEQIAEEIDFLGTEIRASGTKDYSLLSASVLSDFVGEALELLEDIVIDPTFPEKELEKTVRLELASLANKRTQPVYQAKKVYSRVLYGEHPYGAYDTDETVLQSLSRDGLRSLHSGHFRPGLAHLVLSGDIGPEEARRLVEDKFGKWSVPTTANGFSTEITADTRRRVCIADNPNAVQSNIYIGNLAIPYSHPDRVPLLVTNQVLGGTYASRLFMKLREEKSFTYGAYSRVNAQVKGGTLLAFAAVRNEVTRDAIEEFLYEFRRIRDEVVDAKELQAAKDYLTGSFPLQLERSLDVANHIMIQRVHSLPESYWGTLRDRINEVTAEKVMETANKHIHPDKTMICVVGKAKELTSILSEYGEPELFDKTGKPIPQ